MNSRHINGVLLIYHHLLGGDAPTIMQHVNAFGEHSEFKVWSVNTIYGFPERLKDLSFSCVVLHYSLFGGWPFVLPEQYIEYVAGCASSYKVAFFQDEYRYWPQRVNVIERCGIDCIYTLVSEDQFKNTYRRYLERPVLKYNLTGYVSDSMLKMSEGYSKPKEQRATDVGYRARELPVIYGKAVSEKYEIGRRFKQIVGERLVCDIETTENKRIYGEDWYKFLGNCKGVLGVEAGVSIFDIDNSIEDECRQLRDAEPGISDEDLYNRVLRRHEDLIPYRTISPRHFEAAAFRCCQILFEGDYSGVMKAGVHYIRLKKDFSNIDEVLECFNDDKYRNDIVENAYNDLIRSGKYSYQSFMKDFDAELMSAGLEARIDKVDAEYVGKLLRQGALWRTVNTNVRSLRYRSFPGRKIVTVLLGPIHRAILRGRV